MEELLENNNTYSLTKKDPSNFIEKKLNEMVKRWYANDYITKGEMLRLRSSGSSLPKVYGLPKLHKANVLLRLIVSSINTTLYPIDIFLNSILSISIPRADYQVKNSFELNAALSNIIIPLSHNLFSLDVISIFTNVPLNLALNKINKRWEHIERSTKISKKDFMGAIEFVLSSTYFKFRNKIYKQIFGTLMGSPLSPVIENLVMRDLEEHVFNALDMRHLLLSICERHYVSGSER